MREESTRDIARGPMRTGRARWRQVAAACFLLGALASAPALAEPADETNVTAPAAEVPAESPPAAVAASGAAAALPGVARPAEGRAAYRKLIERAVSGTTLPADVADAVMGVESGYNPARIGADGEIGLMQVMPPTARMMGFAGTLAELAVPEVNIRYGITYLAQAWNRAGGDLCTALMKYRAGHGETRFSHLSVDYCVRARSRLAALGYRVVGSVPVATFGTPGSPGTAACRKKCFGFGGEGRVDFAALNNRLTQVVMQVGGPRVSGKQ